MCGMVTNARRGKEGKPLLFKQTLRSRLTTLRVFKSCLFQTFKKVFLDCLQPAFSLKICLVLIPPSEIVNNDFTIENLPWVPETFHARAFQRGFPSVFGQSFSVKSVKVEMPSFSKFAASPLGCKVYALRNFVKKNNRLLVVYSRSGNEVVSKTKHSKTKTEARSTQNSKPVCPLKSRDSPLSIDQCWYSRITNRLQFKTIQVELRGVANAFPPPWLN